MSWGGLRNISQFHYKDECKCICLCANTLLENNFCFPPDFEY